MKKAFIVLLLTLVSFTAFAGGGSETSGPSYGQSEIVFSYDGPQNVSMRLYQNGQFVSAIQAGSEVRRIVADGSYQFEVRPSRAEGAEDTELARSIDITAQDSRVSVNITARTIRSRTVVRDFSVSNTVALNLQPPAPAPPSPPPAAPPPQAPTTTQTPLPEWVSRVPEFADLTASQLQSKFPSGDIHVSGQNVLILHFPTAFSNSMFTLNSSGRVIGWLIVFPTIAADLNRVMYDLLVNSFTEAYGEPRSDGALRTWAFVRGLPEKALGLALNNEQEAITVQWMYGF